MHSSSWSILKKFIVQKYYEVLYLLLIVYNK